MGTRKWAVMRAILVHHEVGERRGETRRTAGGRIAVDRRRRRRHRRLLRVVVVRDGYVAQRRFNLQDADELEDVVELHGQRVFALVNLDDGGTRAREPVGDVRGPER